MPLLAEWPSIFTDSCARPNRARVVLSGFDVDADVVAFDLDALFEGVDLGVNTDKTHPGCMSDLVEGAECAPPFARLGIDWDTGLGAATTPAFRAGRHRDDGRP